MSIHPDVPNDDRADRADRNLRSTRKIVASKLERMESEKERQRRKEPKLAPSAEPTVTEGRGRGDRLALGREARPTEMHDPSSREEGLIRIARLSEGGGAWVKRCSGRWTYAIVKERDDGPDASLRFTVDEKGSTKKFPLAIWHKFLRAMDEDSNEASSQEADHALMRVTEEEPNHDAQKPAGKKASKDENLFEKGLCPPEREQMAESACLRDGLDDLSSSSSSSLSYDVEFKEDDGNEVILQDTELSMYTLGHGDSPRSLGLKVIQDHELSMYTLADADQQPVDNPPVKQACCRSRIEPISESGHWVGSGADAIDAPTEPASSGEVKRTPCWPKSRLQNGPRKLPQLKPIYLQALMTGEALKYRSVTPPRTLQEERPDELQTDRPIDAVEEEAGAEAEIHPAEKERPEANITSGGNSSPRIPRRRLKSLSSILPLPVLEQGEPSKPAKRRQTRPRPKYRASWPANRREETNRGKVVRRDSGLAKEQSFHSALKRIHRGSSSSSSIMINLAYC